MADIPSNEHDELPPELAAELGRLAAVDEYRYEAVLRLAARASTRGTDRSEAVRQALDATAAVDAEVEARMAERLEQSVSGPDFFTTHEPQRRKRREK